MPRLTLTKWNEENAVFVPAGIVPNLKNYHFAGIRFLYGCYHNGLKGAILNHDLDMNFPAQVSSFLNSVGKEIRLLSPALVICSESRMLKWLYHLKIYGSFKVQYMNGNNIENVNERIVLVTFQQLKLLQSISDKNFSFIVVEEFDVVSNRQIFKRLNGKFRIGLTSHNFIQEPNQKVFFAMVNWTNPGVLGKFTQFCKEDIDHRNSFRWPYDKYWHRLTWNFSEKFIRPTEKEKQEYIERINVWAKQEKIECVNLKPQMKRKLEKKIEVFTTSESSNDVVESLGKKVNIRRKKKKLNNKIKDNVRTNAVKIEEEEVNCSFNQNLTNSDNLLTIQKCETVIEEETEKVDKNSTQQSHLTEQTLEKETIQNCETVVKDYFEKLNKNELHVSKRSKSLPFLNFSSEESDNGYEDEDSIILSVIKPKRTKKTLNKSFESQQELCTMLEQSVDEFEENLEKNDDNFDILMSIMSKKCENISKDNSKKKSSFDWEQEILDNDIHCSNDSDCLKIVESCSSSDLDKVKLRQKMLAFLSNSAIEDCDI